MLDLLTPSQFVDCLPEEVGKTRPLLVVGDAVDQKDIEVYVKLKSKCMLGTTTLAVEVISALLAADLDLPVPEPYLVEIGSEFTDIISDPEAKVMAAGSNGLNFGLRKLPAGYALWTPSRSVPSVLLPLAAEIATFDFLIGNDDRRPEKPNCLFNGKDFAIIDHEMAFPAQTSTVLFWKPPWEPGSLEFKRHPQQQHLFHASLCSKPLEFNRLEGAWSAIGDSRLEDYRRSLPASWAELDAVVEILSYIGAVRDNLPACLDEVRKVLR